MHRKRLRCLLASIERNDTPPASGGGGGGRVVETALRMDVNQGFSLMMSLKKIYQINYLI
jgi:hypothetical protein